MKFTFAIATAESKSEKIENMIYKEIVTKLRKNIIEIKRKLYLLLNGTNKASFGTVLGLSALKGENINSSCLIIAYNKHQA